MLRNGGEQLKRGRIQHQRHLLEKERDRNGSLDAIQIVMDI